MCVCGCICCCGVKAGEYYWPLVGEPELLAVSGHFLGHFNLIPEMKPMGNIVQTAA